MYTVEWGTRTVLLLVAMLLATVASGSSAGAQQAKSEELQLTESRNSGVSGTVILKDVGSGVEVTLNMEGMPEAGVAHINHMHGGGTCTDERADNPAPVTIPLNIIMADEDGMGSATTTLEGVTLDELEDPSEQQRYIDFHAEQEEGGGIPPVISCADLTTLSGEQVVMAESTMTAEEYEYTRPLLDTGGVAISSPLVLMSAIALLLGLGALARAVLLHR
jgi:hypothetical protein